MPWRFGSSGKKMRRELFEKCLLALDQEDIDAAIEEGQAEMLLRAVFRAHSHAYTFTHVLDV